MSEHHERVGFGLEPWAVAVAAGVVVVVMALVPVRVLRNARPRVRVYIGVRSAMLAVVGVGIAVGHWEPSLGGDIIGLAFLGLVGVLILHRRITGSALGSPAP